jgi:hypothetical protein
MKRTSSEKSQRSQKSPIEPDGQQHPTVRFDLGTELVPGDDDDNEWTEDSASISPETTRDHTRQNSMILDSNALKIMHASNPPTQPSSATASAHRQDNIIITNEPPTESPQSGIKRSSSTHSISTADAITSRVLMRGPVQNPSVSAVTATGTNTATPTRNNLSVDSYTVVDYGSGNSAAGSAGSHRVGRFINGNSSQGTPSDQRNEAILNARGIDIPDDSPSNGKGKERADNISKSLDSHRRNRSLSNMAGTKSSSRGNPSTSNLPPSRTQQKLDLQRVSSVLESTKHHVIPVLPRPSAPVILQSGLNIGFGFSESEHFTAQTQSLYAQINKEYNVVRRYRQPVSDALARIEPHRISSAKRQGKVRQHHDQTHHDHDQTHRHRHRNMDDNDSVHSAQVPDFRYPKPSSVRSVNRQHLDSEAGSSPEKLNKRRSRVSFEVPPKSIVTSGDAEADADDESDNAKGPIHHRRPKPAESEVLELCRRMWDLNSMAGGHIA